jgi:NAD dependent epimerase/dehydratase family enzyme
MSWIHQDDVAGIMIHAAAHQNVSGVLNAVAPEPVTNKDFSKSLGRALGRPSFFPVPAFMLKLRFGQVAEVITTGQRVSPRRTLDSGYHFRHPTIDGALQNVLSGS